MEFLFYVFIALAINVVIFAVVLMLGKNRDKMSYNQYLQKYGSVADSHPELYSNYNDYM